MSLSLRAVRRGAVPGAQRSRPERLRAGRRHGRHPHAAGHSSGHQRRGPPRHRGRAGDCYGAITACDPLRPISARVSSARSMLPISVKRLLPMSVRAPTQHERHIVASSRTSSSRTRQQMLDDDAHHISSSEQLLSLNVVCFNPIAGRAERAAAGVRDTAVQPGRQGDAVPRRLRAAPQRRPPALHVRRQRPLRAPTAAAGRQQCRGGDCYM